MNDDLTGPLHRRVPAATERDGSVHELLSSIARQARVSNRARAELVHAVVAELPGATSDRIDAATRSAHQLVGSAGTFGMHTASRLARGLERFLSESAYEDERRLGQARQDADDLRDVLAEESTQR